MLAPQHYSKKKLIIVGVLVAIIWLVVGGVMYWYWQANTDSSLSMSADQPAVRPSSSTKSKGLVGQLDGGLLTNPSFTSLKVYGAVPVNPDKLGRSDPFSVVATPGSGVVKK